jgi:MarR family 2-MHQ and catechol resistance regulon transcriptional repressor
MSEELNPSEKTKKFRNEYHKSIINLICTYNYVSDKLREILTREDLTLQQFNILRILRGKHPELVTNSYIKEKMLDKNSDVTRIVDRLIKQGLVARGYSSEDRRKVEIGITKNGLETLARLDHYNDEEDAITSCLSHDEICQLNTLLNKIVISK